MKKLVLDKEEINWCKSNLFAELRFVQDGMPSIFAKCDRREHIRYIEGITIALSWANIITESTVDRIEIWLMHYLTKENAL